MSENWLDETVIGSFVLEVQKRSIYCSFEHWDEGWVIYIDAGPRQREFRHRELVAALGEIKVWLDKGVKR